MTWPSAGRIHRVVLFWASSCSQRSCIPRQGKILIMQFPTKISKALLALMLATPVITALPGTANAQAVTGSIEGSVSDPSGALVPNATITIRNTDLGTARTILTSRDGAFRASGLISGAYTVDAKADKQSILEKIEEAGCIRFKSSLQGMTNPYGDGHAAERVVEILASVSLDENLLRKRSFNPE